MTEQPAYFRNLLENIERQNDVWDPEDEMLEEGQRLDEDSVFISVKWKPGTGIMRADGRRLRGKFKVKRITKDPQGHYNVQIYNGINIKIDATKDLASQGFKFQLQHTEPMTIQQVYDYINSGKIDNDVKIVAALPVQAPKPVSPAKKESINIESYKPNVYGVYKSGKSKISKILETKSKLFHLELENGTEFNFYPDSYNNVLKFEDDQYNELNFTQVCLLHEKHGLGVTGFNLSEDPIIEGLLQEGPITFLKTLKHDVEANIASRKGRNTRAAYAEQLLKDWVQWSGKTGLDASPDNLFSFLTSSQVQNGLPRQGYDPDLVEKILARPEVKQLFIGPKKEPHLGGRYDIGDEHEEHTEDTGVLTGYKKLRAFFDMCATAAFRAYVINQRNKAGEVVDIHSPGSQMSRSSASASASDINSAVSAPLTQAPKDSDVAAGLGIKDSSAATPAASSNGSGNEQEASADTAQTNVSTKPVTVKVANDIDSIIKKYTTDDVIQGKIKDLLSKSIDKESFAKQLQDLGRLNMPPVKDALSKIGLELLAIQNAKENKPKST